MTEIIPYNSIYQNDIDAMMSEIAAEFSLPFTHPGPKSRLPEKYWIALNNYTVAGTIGMNLKPKYAVLKRMFLGKQFRGKDKGVSDLLLQTSIDWAKEHKIDQIFLGTMEQFKAAQMFYIKNGFVSVFSNELPADYEHNPVDTIFYKLDLK